jgi:hypothetical protein
MENINLADLATLDAIKFELNAEGQKRAKGASFEEGQSITIYSLADT